MKENVSVKKYTTFRIGGNAKYFAKIKNKKDLEVAIKEIKEKNISFFVIGGGSNILASDKGYKGAILKMSNGKIEVKKNKIEVEGGAILLDLLKVASRECLTGLEWATGIPGTVGGAIYGNAAAFGFSMKDSIESVLAFNIKKGVFETFSKDNCNFGNKDSIFKQDKNLIVYSAVFNLKKGDKKKIEEKMNELLEKRKKSHPLSFPSAGCIFKNYQGKILDKKIIEKFPLLEKFNKQNMIPVSYLVEQSKLKGKKIGGAKISNKHANFIVNDKSAKKEDVERLIKIIKKEVKKNFNIEIEEEVQKI